MTSTIIFDFDGTVAVGNGPVLAYARQIARTAGERYLAEVTEALEAFDAGSAPSYRDGYDVVGALAERAGVDAETRQEAYLASRAELGTAEAPVDPAPGLAELLARIPAETRVILATNSPDIGVTQVLDSWGLRDRFDEVLHDMGKPAGLGPLVERALADGPVLSVGDIVENDLAPAAALGADTALVGATAAASPAQVTLRGAALADMVDGIVAWASSEKTPVLPGTATHPER
ncbi:HAD family hydrolase [Microbacterium indicum]|uniref:HAD family hydrolase n=1 Tax=Microbacterium indicum TaxID=358100 RepID=UPI0004132A91|nr:HAD family hydrolase [Microbacterium indicum]